MHLTALAGLGALVLAYSACMLDRAGINFTPGNGGQGGTSSSSASGGMGGTGGTTSDGGMGGTTSDGGMGGAGGIGGMGGAGGMPPVLPTIGVGQFHSCTRLDDGTGRCWGLGDSGQLGDGMMADSLVPVTFDVGGDEIVDIQGGFFHTCALLNDGRVFCTGSNADGQLGNGSTMNSATPVEVPGLTAASISVGNEHSCAITTAGTVMCWGINDHGQIGVMGNAIEPTPVAVQGLPNGPTAIQVTAGTKVSCALFDDGNAHCWGFNNHGQLGNGMENDDPAGFPPQQVLLSNIVQIDCGTNTCCAVNGSAVPYCWGSSINGEVGNNTVGVDVLTPTQPDGLTDIRQISTGWDHTCAVATNDVVLCWGDNATEATGTAMPPATIQVPALVTGLTNVRQVSTGVNHTCITTTDMSVRCWGDNPNGELGNGTAVQSVNPVTPIGF